MTRAVLSALACCGCVATASDTKPQFDVASIKPATAINTGGLPFVIPQTQGGPGTNEPGHIVFRNYALVDLMQLAYSRKFSQISAPDWITMPSRRNGDGTFDIEAKLPAGSTKDQMHLMLQSLLEDRFDLKAHRETRQGTVYWLVVAKAGPKLKESPAVAPPNEPLEHEKLGPRGEDGFPVMSPGYAGMFVHVENGVIHDKFMRRSMAEFADWLWGLVKQPVIDHTGLNSIYDFYLTRGTPRNERAPGAQASDPTGSDLFGAVSQLGLKMSPEKGDIEMLVVDHANPLPSVN